MKGYQSQSNNRNRTNKYDNAFAFVILFIMLCLFWYIGKFINGT